ncbi:MAG: peptidylprolyl isomerase [Spirochaetaceae bacterium]|nr:peptidylprolyl isomerase [Spirochaetaceae bacterium]
MIVEKDRVVSIGYSLKDDSGSVIDASEGNEPLVYLHGNGNLIPGLEKRLEGKKAGERVTCVIEPAEGYGEHDESLVFKVTKDEFEGADIEIGMQFEAHGEEGAQIVTVVGIEGNDVTIDANHPLAGEKLHFDVNIVEVRAATPEELEHGHVHGGCECGGDCGDECGDEECGCGSGGCGCGGD